MYVSIPCTPMHPPPPYYRQVALFFIRARKACIQARQDKQASSIVWAKSAERAWQAEKLAVIRTTRQPLDHNNKTDQWQWAEY